MSSTDTIYSEKFNYQLAVHETGCDKVVAKSDCPALRIERAMKFDKCLHPLIALSRCLQCRKEIRGATAKTAGRTR